jgi:hypothetical protein
VCHYGDIALRKVLSWPLELLGSMLDVTRSEDGDPSYAQATDAETQELEAILTAA